MTFNLLMAFCGVPLPWWALAKDRRSSGWNGQPANRSFSSAVAVLWFSRCCQSPTRFRQKQKQFLSWYFERPQHISVRFGRFWPNEVRVFYQGPLRRGGKTHFRNLQRSPHNDLADPRGNWTDIAAEVRFPIRNGSGCGIPLF